MAEKKRLSDFVIEDPLNPEGMGNLDVDKLIQLSNEEFKDLIFEESKAYMKFHGKTLYCWYCYEEIEEPKDLVSYFGRRIHVQCFAEEYDDERDGLEEREQKYFDRIYELFVGDAPTIT